MPFAFATAIYERIAASIELPLTVDFESGYTDDDGELAENVARLIELGAVGVNFEDSIPATGAMREAKRQAQRIAAIRAAAARHGVPEFFINARTDLWLAGEGEAATYVEEALERAAAYASAGASGFFVPGLADEPSIARICESVALPVNATASPRMPANARLAELGVSRISYGPGPYRSAIATLTKEARAVF